MEKLRQLIVSHKAALILALLTSIIVALPQVYFRIDHMGDGVYQGIELLPDSPWSPRVREIQDGHGFGNIYYKDGKDDPYLFQPFGTIVVAYIGNIFSLDINNTFLVSRFLLTFVTSLLIYGFVFELRREKLAALCSVVIILLAESILSYYGLSRISQGMYPEEFLSIGKPVNNTMIFIPFFGFLLSFLLYYRKKYWYYGVISAVFLGINFYNYFYTWSFLYAFGGVFGLILLIRKKWQDARNLGAVFFGGALLAIPYFINLYHASLYSSYEVVSMRFGIVLSHAPLSVGFVVIIALIVFLLAYPREDRSTYFFGLALLLAPFITMNQQIFTGKVMQAGHYHWYFHKPLAVIFVLLVAFYLLSKSRLRVYRELLALSIIFVSLAVGLFIQIDSYKNGVVDGGNIVIERQRYGQVMKWLSAHAEKEAVVFANDELSHATVVYTPLNVFYHRSGYATLAATEGRLLDPLFALYRLRGVDVETVHDVFFTEREYISGSLYGVYYNHLFGSDADIPDEKIEEIISRYREILTEPESRWFQNIFTKYEVEYVVWDKKTDPEWNIDSLSFLKSVADFNDIVIYRFSHDTIVSDIKY